MPEIIYLTGVIVAFIFAMIVSRRFTWSVILGSLMIGIFSWIAVLVLGYTIYIDKYEI